MQPRLSLHPLVTSHLLESARQSAAERLKTATALLALLDPASETYGGEPAVDAFLGAGGPSILRYRLDSMDGLTKLALVV